MSHVRPCRSCGHAEHVGLCPVWVRDEGRACGCSDSHGKTVVVNIHKGDAFEVYIGRAGRGHDGYFGNPFTRDDGLGLYRTHFLRRLATDAEFKRRVAELRGKKLGCFCKPGPCHGDVIVEWLDATDETRREDREERAAILEFDAGLSREEAERQALEMIGPDERELGGES